MTFTGTCAECDMAWRGPHAHDAATEHEDTTGHVVWYDEYPDTTESEDQTGKVTWTVDGPISTGIFQP